MKLFTKSFTITLCLFLLLWVAVSWMDVFGHNDPFRDDGDPHWWNSFVILTEVAG